MEGPPSPSPRGSSGRRRPSRVRILGRFAVERRTHRRLKVALPVVVAVLGILIVVAVVLAADSQFRARSYRAGANSPSGTPSPSPAPVSSGGFTISSVPILKVTFKGLSCTLPVAWADQHPGSARFTSYGFIDLRTGHLAPDPGQAPLVRADLVYDPAIKRWIPGPFSAISPDGTKRVAADVGGLHLIDSATGSSSVLNTERDQRVLAFTSAGIVVQRGQGGPRSSLVMVSPDTGQSRVVTQGPDVWTATRNGYAWTMVSGPLKRVDLNTGDVTTWLDKPSGPPSALLGLDPAGIPLVVDAAGNLARVDAPNHTTPLPDRTQTGIGPGSGVITDARAAWMMGVHGSAGAIWVLQAGHSLEQVTPGQSLLGIRVTGACF